MNEHKNTFDGSSCHYGGNCVLKNEIALIKKWSVMSTEYSWLHQQSFLRYRMLNYVFMIPITMLTTVSGSLDILFSSMETCNENEIDFVQFSSGCMVVLAAVLTTVYNLMHIAETQQRHLNSDIQFDKLARTIDMEMILLNTDKRTYATIEEFIKVVRTDIDHLMDQAPPIPASILRSLHRKRDIKECLTQKNAEIELNVIHNSAPNTAYVVQEPSASTDGNVDKINEYVLDIMEIEGIKKVSQTEKLNRFKDRMKV